MTTNDNNNPFCTSGSSPPRIDLVVARAARTQLKAVGADLGTPAVKKLVEDLCRQFVAGGGAYGADLLAIDGVHLVAVLELRDRPVERLLTVTLMSVREGKLRAKKEGWRPLLQGLINQRIAANDRRISQILRQLAVLNEGAANASIADCGARKAAALTSRVNAGLKRQGLAASCIVSYLDSPRGRACISTDGNVFCMESELEEWATLLEAPNAAGDVREIGRRP